MHRRALKKIYYTYNNLRAFLIKAFFGNLRPISHIYGFDRGEPIDRYYIEKFLDKNRQFIKGNCLEILNNTYTEKYGGENVSRSDILDIDKNNKSANIYADLRNMPEIANESYDCIILTQVLQFIDDYESAIRECKRIMKSGGVLLATLPSLSRIDVASGVGRDFWRWTPAGAKYAFSKYFNKEKLEVEGWGNVLVGTGFWVGMAQNDLKKTQMDYWDPNFPILVSIKAQKR